MRDDLFDPFEEDERERRRENQRIQVLALRRAIRRQEEQENGD